MKSLGLMNLPIEEVALDKNNPRIKQYLEIYGDNITAECVALALSYSGGGDNTTSYHTLRESIKVSHGIIHPIVVNKDKKGLYTVIEGNTRLQIYKEFCKGADDNLWSHIPSLVYEDLTDEDIHKIRLQSHLVGPRDWDAYSKAKYLYELSEELYLPMDNIVSMCGGKKADIINAIDAYKCMRNYYEPLMEEKGYDRDPRDYSKFSEYQKKTKCRQTLIAHGFTDKDFAKWVVNENVDNAMKVRSIPAIFNNPSAFDVFRKKNLTEAEKLLVVETNTNFNLDEVPYDALCKVLTKRLDSIEYKEIKALAKETSYEEKKLALLELQDVLAETVEEIHNKE